MMGSSLRLGSTGQTSGLAPLLSCACRADCLLTKRSDRFARKIVDFLKSSFAARSRRLTHRPLGQKRHHDQISVRVLALGTLSLTKKLLERHLRQGVRSTRAWQSYRKRIRTPFQETTSKAYSATAPSATMHSNAITLSAIKYHRACQAHWQKACERHLRQRIPVVALGRSNRL
jgi:hypothetical protein